MLADPSGLRGVSLGPIGIGVAGSATSVGDSTAFYIEQRWIPVIQYTPNFADGLAAFRAQFEVDFTWGQAANAIQNNQGGGFNADQVNIQTKNVNVAIYPTRNPYLLSILIGTQSVYDNIYDPTITSLFDIVKTGYKLTYLGTDATGLSIFSRYGGIWKASFIPMGAAQPDRAAEGDPTLKFVWLATFDYAYEILPTTIVGLSYWHLHDETQGQADAFEGLVSSGPSSSGLYTFTGGPRTFNIDRPNGHVEFLGMHFNHNIHFTRGPFAASGFAMLNVGRFTNERDDSQKLDSVNILGGAANLELQYNWGKTASDVITFESIFSTGDRNLDGNTYRGAFTLNNYGLPGAVWFNHKCLLLFPFTSTVSNFTGAVTDISNQGFGLFAAIGTTQWDLIPYTLNLKLGAAYARAMADPPARNIFDADGNIIGMSDRGQSIGFEVNAELEWTIRYLMTVGLHAGVLFPGSFYNGVTEVDGTAWAAFTTFTWYAF